MLSICSINMIRLMLTHLSVYLLFFQWNQCLALQILRTQEPHQLNKTSSGIIKGENWKCIKKQTKPDIIVLKGRCGFLLLKCVCSPSPHQFGILGKILFDAPLCIAVNSTATLHTLTQDTEQLLSLRCMMFTRIIYNTISSDMRI